MASPWLFHIHFPIKFIQPDLRSYDLAHSKSEKFLESSNVSNFIKLKLFHPNSKEIKFCSRRDLRDLKTPLN